jgi:hypothetical protein
MGHREEVDIIYAVLGEQKIVVYGEALLQHIVADGEAVLCGVVEIPIGRPETAQVLEFYFATYDRVTMAEVLQAAEQIPVMEQVMVRDLRLS